MHIGSSINQLLLELQESPRWAWREEFNRAVSPSSLGATQASREEHQAGSQGVQKGKVVLAPVHWSLAEHWSMRIYNLSQLLLLGFSRGSPALGVCVSPLFLLSPCCSSPSWLTCHGTRPQPAQAGVVQGASGKSESLNHPQVVKVVFPAPRLGVIFFTAEEKQSFKFSVCAETTERWEEGTASSPACRELINFN